MATASPIEVSQAAARMPAIPSLNIVRGVATIAVVMVHAFVRCVRTWPEAESASWFADSSPVWALCRSPVDAFFVLSGFLMVYLYGQEFGQSGKVRRFWTRRLIRMIPVYYTLTTVGLAVLLLAPSLLTYHQVIELPWALGNYLFVPMPKADGYSSPILGVAWTLHYEVLFYLLFGIGMFFRGGARFVIAAVCALVAAGYLLAPQHPALMVWTGPLLLEFCLGMIVAMIYRRCTISPVAGRTMAVAGIALLLASVLWIPERDMGRVIAWGLPCALIVAGCAYSRLEFKGPLARVFHAMGDASYSIYLLQVFSLPALAIAMNWAGLGSLDINALIIALTVLACFAGWLLWAMLERPVLKHLSRQYATGTGLFGLARWRAHRSDKHSDGGEAGRPVIVLDRQASAG